MKECANKRIEWIYIIQVIIFIETLLIALNKFQSMNSFKEIVSKQ